jgi:predicted adenylyl cyclase CyaB
MRVLIASVSGAMPPGWSRSCCPIRLDLSWWRLAGHGDTSSSPNWSISGRPSCGITGARLRQRSAAALRERAGRSPLNMAVLWATAWVHSVIRRRTTMPRNIEIKARIASVEVIEPTVAALADSGPVEIIQDDTFFHCPNGRLKLRMFSRTEGELIFYRRADRQGPKESFYLRSPTPEPEALRHALAMAYGELGRVQKRRTLFMLGRTRIHLDRVNGLGHFLELEVMLDEDAPAEVGARKARDLMSRLGVEPAQWVEGSYLDLLAGPSHTATAAGRTAA